MQWQCTKIKFYSPKEVFFLKWDLLKFHFKPNFEISLLQNRKWGLEGDFK